MGVIHRLFNGNSNDSKIVDLLQGGAIVVDVRTPQEFRSGHVHGSLNYPLGSLDSNISKLKDLGQALVLCCASGNRSGQAMKILQARGVNCENGGSWKKVERLSKQAQ